MIKQDFFTGEVLNSTSPPISTNITNEQYAAQQASFGKYDYDPNTRIMSQPVSISGNGYSVGGFSPYTMNQPVYGNPYQQYYGYGYANPAFAYQQQMQQQMYYNQQQMNRQPEYFVQPVNFSGEYLPPMGYEEEIERLKLEYWQKEQEELAKTSVNNAKSGYYNPFTGTNYYGVPYYNPYQYNSINTEVSSKIEQMQSEARQNRLNFNMQIAQLAHNYAGDTYDKDELLERYTGKTVTNPYGASAMTYGEIYEQQRYANLIPFDNSEAYREHHARVSAEFHSIIPENSNLKETFDNMGVLHAHYELEEEKHRRRDASVLYNSDDNSYKFFVRRKAAERYAQANGLPLTKIVQETDQAKQSLMGSFSTLSEVAKLTDDGTLNITCNFGSKSGQVYSVHNSQESEYEKDRERFQQYLDTIPESIYLNGPTASGT